MPALCDVSACSGCSACASICPKGCISMAADREGFLRPVVDAGRCVDCGLCQRACPVLHPPALPEQEPQLLAVLNSDDSDRARAASGGVFILLARQILKKGGVVFGAAFRPNHAVEHCAAETEADVYRFCGPKYLQSVIGDAYRQAKEFLEQGRYVLFSGTPCQIMGLRSFLGRDYPTLLAVDLICHGVPSPAVWNRYVRERALKDGGEPETITFRSKEKSWSGYEVRFRYEGAQYQVHHRDDPYMRGFLRDLYLRPSCHRCVAKGIRRVSDVTLADLWGAQKLCPELFDDKGTSLVMLHSEKGKAVWGALASQVRCAPVSQDAIGYNPAAICSVTPHPNRALFFARFADCDDLSALILELTPDPIVKPPSLYRRIRGKLGRMLRSLKSK
ncbi:MAG: Coenzyme F420 hydrogenase/dehydrogenase, beta subunit C-terminal domain [Oscillospiraceae bacterium]|nr:Coenzyme F420 hydrogenase/dehydrogenase, beta subunit C-terminal domain [Oscillospiraceae bacterium]